MEYGQIAPLKVSSPFTLVLNTFDDPESDPETNAESSPSSDVALFSTNTSYPLSSPRNMMNDISENPSWSPLSCPSHISHLPITVTLNARFTLVSPQESVRRRYYRHERPVAIVRPALKYPIKTMDNSQGKCARYKVKLRPMAH